MIMIFVCCSLHKFNNKSEDDTFIRAIGNKIFTFTTRILLNLDLTDSLFLSFNKKKRLFKKLNRNPQIFEFVLRYRFCLPTRLEIY